jgi:hypothetical protein
VALQGTLETFALPDVLRLLASTHKTGRLRLTGSAGSGSLWLTDGAIVASEASRAPLAHSPSDVLFELLRFKEGDFVFDDDATSAEAGDPADVEDALGSAEALLEEWKSIEAVVPSLDGWVTLQPELAGDEVTLDAERWRQVVAVASGATVAQLGERLGLAELPASRTVKDLVELGLVEIGEAPAEAPSYAPEPEPAVSFAHVEPEAEVREPEPPVLTVVGDDSPADSFSSAFSSSSSDVFDPNGLVIEEPSYASLAPEAAELPSDEDDMADAAEIARQLANLSPKAAKAVAAAAKATTTEEREAALAEVDDTEDPINRGLLLKFLGSVNS